MRHARIIRPQRTLIGWQRIAVAAGAQEEVRIPLRLDRLKMLDCEGRPVELAGVVDLYAGFDSTADIHLVCQSAGPTATCCRSAGPTATCCRRRAGPGANCCRRGPTNPEAIDSSLRILRGLEYNALSHNISRL